LNLVYELIALPLAFHPATALLRRRISETRELGCDELVTDRLLEPAVYARSLVKLAGAAIMVGRPAATIAVGIADADILEERVMTILHRPKTSLRRKNLLLATAALVFVVPCVAAAPFALRVGISPRAAAPPPQEARSAAQEDKEKELKMLDEKRRRELEELLKHRAAELEALRAKLGANITSEEEAKLKEQLKLLEHQMTELKLAGREGNLVVEFQGAELARMAQIPMYQAIQIATAQQPGTVLECRLRGNRVEDRETVYYDVRILSAEGAQSTVTRFAISAIDGRVLKTEKR
jgi:uncharacterized membrane protein YkoI